ncbi:MAG: 3-hydroxy-9,10-secoandrosta-1,3,5(10)-triene-9,17-dione monooxygenase reductase component [Rhodothermales bacterium]
MSESQRGPEVTGDDVRAAMRSVPAPVTVVVIGGPDPRGITIGSFVTVSLEPPMVSFNVQQSAQIHDDLLRSERFAVHVLASDQSRYSEVFADPGLTGAEQFARVDFLVGADGLPSLSGTLVRLLCTLEASHPVGDHSLVLGRIESIGPVAQVDALLYVNRGYSGISAADGS